MNSLLSILIPAAAGTPPVSARAHVSGPATAPSAGNAFATLLTKRPGVPVASPAAPPSDPALHALEKKIADLLAHGTSIADITAQLAATLAGSIATQLGATGADARAHLQREFASALAPPGGTGPPGPTTAEIARTLAQRFAAVADVAARVAESGQTGQLNRFVGNDLDAATARATPAPTTTTTTATTENAGLTAGVESRASASDLVVRASAGLAASSPAAPAAANVATPVALAAAAASDGQTVAFDPARAASSGGATPLGRVLARAAGAAEARSVAAPRTAAGDERTVTPVARLSGEATVALFLKSFRTVLAAEPDPLARRHADALPSVAAPASDPGAGPALPALPAAPVTVHSNGPEPATPASAPAPADAGSVVDQLRGAFIAHLGRTNEIRLQLLPAHLGDLSVKLVVSDGTVNAHVVAQTADARDALVAGTQTLTKSLADAGLKLSSFTVDVQNGGFAGFPQQQQSQQRPAFGLRRSLVGGIDADDGGDEAELLAMPSFGPPLVGGPVRGAYNYLV